MYRLWRELCLKRKPHYLLTRTMTVKQSRQKLKKNKINKWLTYKYSNEQHHGIKRTILCGIKISLWKNRGSPKEHEQNAKKMQIIYLGYPWYNGYCRRKWTLRHEFNSWTWLIAFHIALIPLGKVWIQLFSLQLWVNSRADYVLQPWRRNSSRNSNLLNSAKTWLCVISCPSGGVSKYG